MEFNNVAIGNVIKNLRERRGYTQDVLSALAGIGRSHLADIERDAKHPNFETVWKIAQAFDLNPHEFVAMIEEETAKYEK